MSRIPAPSYDPVVLPDQEEWLLRPVLRGMCKYESLKDGTLDLSDILAMNDMIDVQTENEWRANEAVRGR